MEVTDNNGLYSQTLPEEFSPQAPKGVILGSDNKPVIGSTGNPEWDALLAEVPPEQREEVLAKLAAPETPQEIDAKAKADENFVMSYDQFLVWEPWKAEQEGEFWKSLGEGIDAFKESVAQGGKALADDPLGSLAKLPASVTEGFWQATREFVLMAVDSETPDSIVFKLNNVIRNRGTAAERYNGYVEARKTNALSNRLYRGEETLVINKDLISPEVTQVVTWVADPPFLGPAAATFMRGTGKILNTGDMLSKAQMKAQTIYAGVVGGTLKWGAGVPLEAIGGAVSNTIDMGVRKAAGLVEIGTGIAAEDATKFARVAGIGTASAHVAGVSIPYAGPIAAASVGGSILESVGTALRLTGEQIVNQKGYKGVFGYARQALMETEEALKKTNGQLSDKTKIFLRAIDTIEPVLSYSYDIASGAVGGALISGGMGYANAKMDGLGAGLGVGGILGAAGSLTARTILDVSGASRRWREQVQIQFGLENLRKSKPNLAHNWSTVFSHPLGDVMSRLQMGRTFVMAESVIPRYDMKAFYGADSGYADFAKLDPERPDVASFESTDAYTIRRMTDGAIEIGLNLDNLFNPSKKFKGLTMAHEFHHVLMRDTVLGKHYGRLFRETTFGVRDQNGILVQRGLVPTNELIDWARNYSSLQNDFVIRNYLSLVDPDNANDRATINKTKAELIEAVRSYADDLDVGKPTKLSKTQDDLISYVSEEFGSYYYSLWANEKPMEYWLLGGKLEGLKAAMDIAGSAWADHWESRITRHGTMFDFHKLRKGIEVESVFMKDGKRVRVGALDYLLEDLVRASHSLKNNGYIDISNASKSFVDDLTRNGSDELIGFDPKTGRVRIKKAKEIAVEMAARGKEMAKVLDALDPSQRTSIKGPDGVYRGKFSDFEIDTFVQAGLMSGGMAQKIKLLQRARDNWQNGMPNVFETTYFGASMETGVGPNPPRVRGNKVAVKNRRFLLAGLDFAVGEDGTHKFNVRSIDLKVVERRVAEMFLRPEVRAVWHSTEALARDFFENYLPYMSLDHSVPERQLGSQSIWQEHGSFKRDVMHQIAGFAKSQDLAYANRPMDEIPRGMLSSITDFSIGRMLNIQTDGTNYRYNHENAFWDIARNFSLSNFEKTSSDAGDIYKGKMGHKIVSRNGVNIAFDENGEKIGSYKTVAEVESALDDNFTKRASIYPDIQKEGFNAVTRMANFSLTNVDAMEFRRRIVQEMESGVPWNQTSAIKEAIGADAEIPVWAYDEILHKDLINFREKLENKNAPFSVNSEHKVAATDGLPNREFLKSIMSALNNGEMPSQSGIVSGKKIGLLVYLATTPVVDTRFSLGSLSVHRDFYRNNINLVPTRNRKGMMQPSSLGPYCEIADSLSFQVNSSRVARRSDVRLPSGMPAMSRWVAGIGGDSPVYYYKAPSYSEAAAEFGSGNFLKKAQIAHMEMAIKSGAKWFLKDMTNTDGSKGVELIPIGPEFFESIQQGKSFADSSLVALDSNYEIKDGKYVDVRPLELNRGENSDGVDITMQKASEYASSRIPRKAGDVSTTASKYSTPRELREMQGEGGAERLSQLRRYSINNISEDEYVASGVSSQVFSKPNGAEYYFSNGPLFKPVVTNIDPQKFTTEDLMLLYLKQKEAAFKVTEENPLITEEEWSRKFAESEKEKVKTNAEAFMTLGFAESDFLVSGNVSSFMKRLKEEGYYFIARGYANNTHFQAFNNAGRVSDVLTWNLGSRSSIDGELISAREDSLDPYDVLLTRKMDDTFSQKGYAGDIRKIEEENVTLQRGNRPNEKWDADDIRRWSRLSGMKAAWEKYYDHQNIQSVAANWEALTGGFVTAVVKNRNPSFDSDFGTEKPFVTLAYTPKALEFRGFIRSITGQDWKRKGTQFRWDGDRNNQQLQERARTDAEFLAKFKELNDSIESMLALANENVRQKEEIKNKATDVAENIIQSKTYEVYKSEWDYQNRDKIDNAEEEVFRREIIEKGFATVFDNDNVYKSQLVFEEYELRMRALATLAKVQEAFELHSKGDKKTAGELLRKLHKDYKNDAAIIPTDDASVFPWGPRINTGILFDDSLAIEIESAEKSYKLRFGSLAYADSFKPNLSDVVAEITSRFPNGISAKNLIKELQNTHNRGIKVIEEAKITGLTDYLNEQAKKPKVNGKDPKIDYAELDAFVKKYAMGVTARKNAPFDISDGAKKYTLDLEYTEYGNLTVHSTNPFYHPAVARGNHVLDANGDTDVSTYAHARFTYRSLIDGGKFVYTEEMQSNNNKKLAENAEQYISNTSQERIDKLASELLPFVSKVLSEKNSVSALPSIRSSIADFKKWAADEWSYSTNGSFDFELNMHRLVKFSPDNTPKMLAGIFEYAVEGGRLSVPMIKAVEGVTKPLEVNYKRLVDEVDYAMSNYGEALYWLVDDFNVSERPHFDLSDGARASIGFALIGGKSLMNDKLSDSTRSLLMSILAKRIDQNAEPIDASTIGGFESNEVYELVSKFMNEIMGREHLSLIKAISAFGIKDGARSFDRLVKRYEELAAKNIIMNFSPENHIDIGDLTQTLEVQTKEIFEDWLKEECVDVRIDEIIKYLENADNYSTGVKRYNYKPLMKAIDAASLGNEKISKEDVRYIVRMTYPKLLMSQSSVSNRQNEHASFARRVYGNYELDGIFSEVADMVWKRMTSNSILNALENFKRMELPNFWKEFAKKDPDVKQIALNVHMDGRNHRYTFYMGLSNAQKIAAWKSITPAQMRNILDRGMVNMTYEPRQFATAVGESRNTSNLSKPYTEGVWSDAGLFLRIDHEPTERLVQMVEAYSRNGSMLSAFLAKRNVGSATTDYGNGNMTLARQYASDRAYIEGYSSNKHTSPQALFRKGVYGSYLEALSDRLSGNNLTYRNEVRANAVSEMFRELTAFDNEFSNSLYKELGGGNKGSTHAFEMKFVAETRMPNGDDAEVFKIFERLDSSGRSRQRSNFEALVSDKDKKAKDIAEEFSKLLVNDVFELDSSTKNAMSLMGLNSTKIEDVKRMANLPFRDTNEWGLLLSRVILRDAILKGANEIVIPNGLDAGTGSGLSSRKAEIIYNDIMPKVFTSSYKPLGVSLSGRWETPIFTSEQAVAVDRMKASEAVYEKIWKNIMMKNSDGSPIFSKEFKDMIERFTLEMHSKGIDSDDSPAKLIINNDTGFDLIHFLNSQDSDIGIQTLAPYHNRQNGKEIKIGLLHKNIRRTAEQIVGMRMFANRLSKEMAEKYFASMYERWNNASKRFALFLSGVEPAKRTTSRIVPKAHLEKFLSSKLTKEVYSSSYPELIGFAEYLVSGYDAIEAAKEYHELVTVSQASSWNSNEFLRARGTRYTIPTGEPLNQLGDKVVRKSMQFFKLNNGRQFEQIQYGGKNWHSEFMHGSNKVKFSNKAWMRFDAEHKAFNGGLYTLSVYPKAGHESLTEDGKPVVMKVYVDEAGEAQGLVIQNADSPLAKAARLEMQMRMDMNPMIASYNDNQKSFDSPVDISQLPKPRLEPEPKPEDGVTKNVPMFSVNQKPTASSSPWQRRTMGDGSILTRLDGYIIAYSKNKFRLYNPYRVIIGIYDDEETAKKKADADAKKKK